jgi:glyoxylase-like metal-dependent hydrolase (beta-lactamase superfamily II)
MTLRIEQHGDVTRLRMSSVGSRAARLDVSAYVVRGVMIDAGFRRVARDLAAAMLTVAVHGVVLTHWHEDHAGNIPELAAGGLPVAMRTETDSILRTRPAIQLYRRVVWGWPTALAGTVAEPDLGGLETIHTPGHSADHQAVWDPGTHTLFSGDLWLGVRSALLHSSEDPYEIVHSLERVRALEPARMFDAHRGLVTDPVGALKAKIEWLGHTLATVAERVRRGESDRQIVRELLGGEELPSVVSRGDYSRRNLVRAVRRRMAVDSRERVASLR